MYANEGTRHDVIETAASRWRDWFSDLLTLLEIPSISTDPAYADEVQRCAETLAEQLRSVGMENIEVLPTKGYPIVYADWKHAGEAAPTLLIYAHYDVQPADPLDQWESPPFEPEERDGYLYGRGTADDKAQLWMHVNAIRAYLASRGEIPVNIKLIVEGEEEIGSPNLTEFLKENQELLQADAVIISDTAMLGPDTPSIGHGLRGVCNLEVNVETLSNDLHSGFFGGAVPNAAIYLAQVIASMKDENGKITIPGFHDEIQELSEAERQELANIPFDDEAFLASARANALTGEAGFSTLERRLIRPTLDVTGIWGGYSGVGSKTIVPAQAGAKLSMRLVPDQTPETIASLVTKHIEESAPEWAKVSVTYLGGTAPFLTSPEHPIMQAASRAVEQAYNKKPVLTRQPGTIGFVTKISSLLGAPCVLFGFGLPDQHTHAPNERFSLDQFWKGTQSAIYLYEQAATTMKSSG